MQKSPTLYLEDGSEIELPFKYVICDSCDGHGKSSAYLGAYTQEDMDEAGPEFMEDYIAGHYDRACDTCNGTGKVKVADRSRMTKEQRKEWLIQRRAEAEVEAESRHERMMLGGY